MRVITVDLFSGMGGLFIPVNAYICFMKKVCICSICSKEFVSYNPTPTYCSRQCKSTSQMADIDQLKVVELYESGMSQDEVAEALNTTQKVIHNVFRRMGYKCRPKVKRNQYGENNTSWKGDKASYEALHYRLYATFGRPAKCDFCGTTEAKAYDWACIGDYRTPKDYRRLCRSCHHTLDNKGNNFPNNDRTPTTRVKDFKKSCEQSR